MEPGDGNKEIQIVARCKFYIPLPARLQPSSLEFQGEEKNSKGEKAVRGECSLKTGRYMLTF